MSRTHSNFRQNITYLVCFCVLTAVSSPASGESPQGAVYHPPQSLLEVKVKTTRITTKYVDADADCSVKKRHSETFKVDLVHRLVPQSSCELDLGRQRGRWSTGEVTARFSPQGLLTSVNSTAEGQGGAAIRSVFQLVGGIAGLLTGSAGWVADTASETGKKRVHPKVQCFVQQTQEGSHLDKQVRSQRDLVGDLRAEYRQLVREAAGKEPGELKPLNERLAFLKAQIEQAESTVETYSTQFEEGLSGYQRSLGLGTTTAETERVFALRVADLHSSATFAETELHGSEVDDALTKAASKRLYEATGLVLTVGPLSGAAPKTKGPAGACPVTIPKAPEKTVASVYYRTPRTYLVRIYAPTRTKLGNPAMSNLEAPRDVRLVGQETVGLFHPNAPLHLLAMESKAFGKRGMSVTFSEDGRLTEVKTQVDKASGSDLLGAFAAGPSGLVDSYAGILKSLAATTEDRQKVLLGGLSDEVERLKKEKERIDAELALNGVAGNRDLLERQARLDAEIGTLERERGMREAELNLEVTEATYQTRLEQQRLAQELALLEQQLGLENAEATFALKLQLAKLEAQVEVLQKQLQLRQAETNADPTVEQGLLTLQLENMRLRLQLEEVRRQLADLLEDGDGDDDEEPEEEETP